MADARPFLLPVSIIVAGVEHRGTYDVEDGTLSVHYGDDCMRVELGEALARRRAETVLRELVARRKR